MNWLSEEIHEYAEVLSWNGMKQLRLKTKKKSLNKAECSVENIQHMPILVISTLVVLRESHSVRAELQQLNG